jgi:hypothetical protein
LAGLGLAYLPEDQVAHAARRWSAHLGAGGLVSAFFSYLYYLSRRQPTPAFALLRNRD